MMHNMFSPAKNGSENSIEKLSNLLKKKFDLTGNLKMEEQQDKIYIEIPEQGFPGDGSKPKNALAIDYFKSIGVNEIAKTHPQHSYWTTTCITMDKIKCNDAIKGLELLMDAEPKPQMFARC